MNRPQTVDKPAERAWQRARDILLAKLGRRRSISAVKSLRLFAATDTAVQLVAPTAAGGGSAAHPGALDDALASRPAAGRPPPLYRGFGRSEEAERLHAEIERRLPELGEQDVTRIVCTRALAGCQPFAADSSAPH